MYTVETIDAENNHWVSRDFPTVEDAMDCALKLVESYGNMREVKPFSETSVARWQKNGDYAERVYISVYPTKF